MSLGSALDTKEQVRQAIDIAELVGQYLPLRREGRIYKATCPWHDDTRPSLQVNPERQTWKCWVCDIGGDVFSFVMRREGVTFPEALAMLAERAGIPLEHSRQYGPEAAQSGASKRHLYQAAAWAEQQFHNCLLHEADAEPARRYLAERGISDESIRRFHLGYAPNSWDWLLRRAEPTDYSAADLEKIGLAARSDKTGRRYDRFRGRVLFSIRDAQARPIAMGGRVLPELADDKTAKYINSPETPLFSKSGELYGLDVARPAIQTARHAIVMEGYTDCVIAVQHGFENVLAVLGTALGERHVRLLSRYADRITLVLDGDEAGKRRANEILDLFVAGQLEMRVLTLPDGLDPCDFLLQRGADQFSTAIDGAVDALDHKIRAATRGVDPGDGSYQANQALEDVLGTLARAPTVKAGGNMATKLREDQFLSRLAREFRVAENTLRGRMVELRRSARRPVAADHPNENVPARACRIHDAWQRELIEILMQEPEAVSSAAESLAPEQLTDAVCRQIYAKCCELSAAGHTPDLDRLLLEFDNPEMQSLLVGLDESGRDRGGSDLAKQLPDLLASFARRREEVEQRARTAALKEKRFDESEEVEVLHQLFEQQRARQREK